MAETQQTEHPQQPRTHQLEKPHPTERTYVIVAAWLFLITAVEIAMSYIDVHKWIIISSLIVLGFLKFYLVVQWFMHLKFDHPTLRKPFVAGAFIALAVYSVVLVTLVYRSNGGT